jgi:hypothetical protein
MYKTSVPIYTRRIKERSCLEGSICNKCMTKFYPKRNNCNKCNSSDLNSFKFNGRGKIVSFSTIYSAPSGFENQVPYIIALIELEEGPKLLSQIVDSDRVEIGDKVEICVRKVFEDGKEGIIQYGIKFRHVSK